MNVKGHRLGRNLVKLLTRDDAQATPFWAPAEAGSGDVSRKSPPCLGTRSSRQLANAVLHPAVPMREPKPPVARSASRHWFAQRLSTTFSVPN